MLMSEIYFTPTQVARSIGVCRDSVHAWCRSGKLKAKKSEKTGKWIIPGISFANFLYKNSRYQRVFRTSNYCHFNPIVQKIILQEIDSRPHLFDIFELCEIFDVRYDTVDHWILNGEINGISIQPIYGGRLFNEKNLEDFVHRNPRYAGDYKAYAKSFLKGEI